MGSKYFAAGWYRTEKDNLFNTPSEYELTQFDLDNGQVMLEKDWRDELWSQLGGKSVVAGGIRNWNGYAVNSKGYLTGEFFPNVQEINALRSISRFLSVFSRLAYSTISRAKLLQKIKDPRIQNLVNDLYREGNIGKTLIGNGSAMDAYRYTRLTKVLVGGSDHAKKLAETLKRIRNLMKDPNLGKFDSRVLKEIKADILNALGGN